MCEISKEHVLDFINLQNDLFKSFVKIYPQIKDYQWLTDFPKEGVINIRKDEKWNFIKHGSGVKFFKKTSPFLIVDMHDRMNNPNAIDVWRLNTFFESRFGYADTKKTSALIEQMCVAGEIKKDFNKKFSYKHI